MGSINNLSSSYLQSVLNNVLQSSGSTTSTAQNSASTTSASSVAPQTDSRQLSPFAQLMSTLQQLQQSDPAKYAQVTQQIATNLQTAAQTATSAGNTTAASQLTQLATDFTNASKSGQLPNVQDLAQAVGGHHHHHHHAHAAAADSDSTSSTNGTSSGTASGSGASQALSQFLSGAQASGTQNDPLNPMAIIRNTLSNAGITSA
jgi:hypothetical protein